MVAMGRTRREGEAAQALALGRIRRNVNRWPPTSNLPPFPVMIAMPALSS